MPTQPDDEILTHFGVHLVAPLGGRLNQHWLVEAHGERLVLRRWWRPAGTLGRASIDYEVCLVARLAALGWPVAVTMSEPAELAGHLWSLAPFLPGEVSSAHGPRFEQRARGRLLAQFHRSLAQHADLTHPTWLGQRAGWRRCEEILADPTLDDVLARNQQRYPEETRILRWHLARARERIAGLALSIRPGLIIHGDFTPWNLRFSGGRLCGILDFELAHWDHRVGDFALSWRGKYDGVIQGYVEVSPLEPEEWALITPLWWAGLIDGACRDLQQGTLDDGWTIKKLLQRSDLMGPDAAAFQ